MSQNTHCAKQKELRNSVLIKENRANTEFYLGENAWIRKFGFLRFLGHLHIHNKIDVLRIETWDNENSLVSQFQVPSICRLGILQSIPILHSI